MFYKKKVFLKISQNSQEITCGRVSFLIKLQAEVYNFIKKENLAQGFSCEFCEIVKNNFVTEHLSFVQKDRHYFYIISCQEDNQFSNNLEFN